jgi:hypothetical protein
MYPLCEPEPRLRENRELDRIKLNQVYSAIASVWANAMIPILGSAEYSDGCC